MDPAVEPIGLPLTGEHVEESTTNMSCIRRKRPLIPLSGQGEAQAYPIRRARSISCMMSEESKLAKVCCKMLATRVEQTTTFKFGRYSQHTMNCRLQTIDHRSQTPDMINHTLHPS